MTEYVDTYCPKCDAEVRAHLRSQQAMLSVRGENVTYNETIAICPTCGSAIGDSRIEGANLEHAYGIYRARHGIMSPGEIKSLRDSYGLSLREFSRFLGFGEQTAYRYERGDLPDQAHANTLRSAETIDGARFLLSQSRSRLTKKSVGLVEHRIQMMEAGATEEARRNLTLEQREADAPSASNGYRRLSLDRALALAFVLAEKCRDLYWTKLQKAAFFVDMAYFDLNGRSLTGLTYAHATYGPVIDRKEEIRFILADKGIVTFQEYGYGEILLPLAYDGVPFTTEELSFIDEIAKFVNTFDSASELSDFSHALGCWASSVDGETIEYTSDSGEVAQSITERLNKLPA